ncbi:MAG: histidine phosphatase family protein [Sphingomonas sp.]|nr:histidine phosphatase family protein [Sphingomonas sp.]
MKRTIYLVRHGSHGEVGHVLSGRSEVALNAQGKAEAEALAHRLASVPIASIHSSPRKRTRETAAAIAACHASEVRIAEALDEIDFGRFAGRGFAELAGDPDWRHWNAERATARCPEGETMAEASARAMAYIKSLPPGQAPALCVSHCDVIRGLVAQTLNLGFDGIFAFDCDPASLTTLEFEGSVPRLVALNERVPIGCG